MPDCHNPAVSATGGAQIVFAGRAIILVASLAGLTTLTE